MILKLLGKLYQLTGYMNFYAIYKQNCYIIDHMEEICKEYELYAKEDDDPMGLHNYISMRIGMWQIKYGFYRFSKSVFKDLDLE